MFITTDIFLPDFSLLPPVYPVRVKSGPQFSGFPVRVLLLGSLLGFQPLVLLSEQLWVHPFASCRLGLLQDCGFEFLACCAVFTPYV